MASVAPQIRLLGGQKFPAGVELEYTDANTIAGAILAVGKNEAKRIEIMAKEHVKSGTF